MAAALLDIDSQRPSVYFEICPEAEITYGEQNGGMRLFCFFYFLLFCIV